MRTLHRVFAGLTFGLLLTTSANAALVSRSGGSAYYDTDTNLTWVADANLAQTSGYDADGFMNWTTAVGWAASLNTQNAGLGYLGVNNWRLPTVTDTANLGCNQGFSGTDCGFNVDLASGEMARMYYGTLSNTGLYTTGAIDTGCGVASPYCLTNSGPFLNLAGIYWANTYTLGATLAWTFNINLGEQGFGGKSGAAKAWAVRPGDIALDAVPIPPAVWLFGSALGLMGAMRRKISS